MTWENVKRILPNQWVIIEAIEAHTEGNKRILGQYREMFGFSYIPGLSLILMRENGSQ